METPKVEGCDPVEMKVNEVLQSKQIPVINTNEGNYYLLVVKVDNKDKPLFDKSLKEHIKESTSKKSFRPLQFGKDFGAKKDFEIPKVEKKYSCDHCTKAYEEKKFLKCHLAREHKIKETYSCKECGKNFERENHLERHLRTHSGEYQFSCQDCTKVFSHPDALARHKKIHSGDKPFQCDECGKCFTRKDYLKNHEVVHNENVFCEICSEYFAHEGKLKIHLKKMHKSDVEKVKPLEEKALCDECGQGFDTKVGLKCHMQWHIQCKAKGIVDKKKTKYSACHVCGKHMLTASLKIHMRIHTKEDLIPCSFCGKAFAQKGTLREHEKIHTGERPYICQECGKSFTSKTALDRHMRYHRGEKPFTCILCGKCFSQKSNLKQHMNKTHNSKPNYFG